MKFTIITPTVLRPSLQRTCESISNQSYADWQHIVMVDIPGAKVPDELRHPQREWQICGEAHGGVGNHCVHNAYPLIKGDYVLYMDDDDMYLPGAFAALESSLRGRDIAWGVFPGIFMGERFLDPPAYRQTMKIQLFHRPVINGKEIRYLDTLDYCADGAMTEYLRGLCDPVVIDGPELVEVTNISLGDRGDLGMSRLRALVKLHGYKTDKNEGILFEYEKIFEPRRSFPVRLLELGVHQGESLRLWSAYFYNAKHIVGIDRDTPDTKWPGGAESYQGSQEDTTFLDRIKDGWNFIIDDCSHLYQPTKTSFWYLFENQLRPGGFYCIEDWLVAYTGMENYETRKYQPEIIHDVGMARLVHELVDNYHLFHHSRFESILVTPGVVIIRKRE